MGSSSAPEPDPQIGEAALKSAETGERLLEWMQESSVMPTQWAEEDRARYEEVFLPIQDQFIENALSYDTAERRDAEESKAVASLRQTQAISDATRQRQAAAMGVDPQSGRYQSMERAASLDNSLAEVGVRNAARTNVENTGMALMGDAINMGSGLAVNPGTSLSIASGMNEAGFSGAIQGYQTQGNLLNQQYQNQLAGWQASQNAQAGMLGGLGGLLGAGANLAANGGFAAILSSKEAKTDRKKHDGSLGAIEQMPVEKWRYKEGTGMDDAEHVGPYAEDFKEATGLGDGKTINVVDAIGITMGAIQELSRKVDNLAKERIAA